MVDDLSTFSCNAGSAEHNMESSCAVMGLEINYCESMLTSGAKKPCLHPENGQVAKTILRLCSPYAR
jgi:hypothetical protein